MANDNFTQQALANDPTFRQRVKASMTRIAFQVLGESTGTTGHNTRTAYARAFLAAPDSVVASMAGWFVFRTNVINFTTSVGFNGQGGTVVTTAAADADLDSQINSDWNSLAGV